MTLTISMVLLMHKPDRADEKDLESYAKAYLKKYKEVVEDNSLLLQGLEHVFFKYNNNPKAVYGVISKNHGAAIVFKYNSTEEAYWNYRLIDEPIEYYFWPNMSSDLSNLKIVKIARPRASSEFPYVLNSQISIKNSALLLVNEKASLYYAGEGESPFKIEGPGAIVILGESFSKSGLIIKGTNTKQAWSIYQAGLDALKHFFWDCGNRLNETTIKQIEAKHKVPLLLDKITENLKNKYYKDHPEEFYNDLHELEQLGLSEEMKTSIWSEYLELKREPTLWEKIVDFISQRVSEIIVAVIAGIIVGYILHAYTH